MATELNTYLHDWIFIHLNFKLEGWIFKIQLCSLSLEIYVHGFLPLKCCDIFDNCYSTQESGWTKKTYIFSLSIFVAKNRRSFQTSLQIHGLNTRRKFNFYCPQTKLTVHQKGPYCFGIKLFNCLPLKIKELVHDFKLFRMALKAFIHSKSFYTVQEYFDYTNELWFYSCKYRSYMNEIYCTSIMLSF
jgi:hypothetical protein